MMTASQSRCPEPEVLGGDGVPRFAMTCSGPKWGGSWLSADQHSEQYIRRLKSAVLSGTLINGEDYWETVADSPNLPRLRLSTTASKSSSAPYRAQSQITFL